MKKTPFKKKEYKWERKPYVWKKKPKKEGKGLFDHLNKESKDHEWARIKREIKPFFVEHGLYYICELQLPNVCVGSVLNLTYAHSKKRGDIAKKEPERTRELKEVVRACPACHHKIEYLPKTETETGREQMYRIVTDCIKRRNRRLGL